MLLAYQTSVVLYTAWALALIWVCVAISRFTGISSFVPCPEHSAIPESFINLRPFCPGWRRLCWVGWRVLVYAEAAHALVFTDR